MKWNNIKEIQPKNYENVLVLMQDGTITGAYYFDLSSDFVSAGFYPVGIRPFKQYNHSCECKSHEIPADFYEQPKLWATIEL